MKSANNNLWSVKRFVALKMILTFLVTDTHSLSNNCLMVFRDNMLR